VTNTVLEFTFNGKTYGQDSYANLAEILVSGLEVKYYVRGAMDFLWSTLDEMVKDLLEDEVLLNLCPDDRRRVTAAAMRGWQTHRAEEANDGFLPAFRIWGQQRVKVFG